MLSSSASADLCSLLIQWRYCAEIMKNLYSIAFLFGHPSHWDSRSSCTSWIAFLVELDLNVFNHIVLSLEMAELAEIKDRFC